MEHKSRMPNGAERMFRAKTARRRTLARLPIEKKIAILTQLQSMANEIRIVARGAKRRSWAIR